MKEDIKKNKLKAIRPDIRIICEIESHNLIKVKPKQGRRRGYRKKYMMDYIRGVP